MRSQRPTQAVLLAGGRGARLRPLTDTVPKPMLEFHGRPFLAYLLEQLAAQSIERVMLLVGYRGAQIRAYVGEDTVSKNASLCPLNNSRARSARVLKYCHELYFLNISGAAI